MALNLPYKKKGPIAWAFSESIGRGERIRTSDPSVPNRVLYQAEPRPDPTNAYLNPEATVNATVALAVAPVDSIRASTAAAYFTSAFSNDSASTAASAWWAVKSGCSGVTETYPSRTA